MFFGKARKADINWSKAIDYPEAKRASFVQTEIEESVKPDILAAIRKNGIPFDQWEKYRTQYHWVPTFIKNGQPPYVSIISFNGENGKLNLPIDDDATKQVRPITSRASFKSLIKGEAEEQVFIINFDEAEMFAAFAKLGGNQEQLYLEFAPTLPKPDTKIRLYNKESIELTGWKVDVW